MGGAGAVEVLYAREAKEQENPAQFLAEKEAEYTKLFANPYNAAKYGYIDDVIEPRNTRFRIIRCNSCRLRNCPTQLRSMVIFLCNQAFNTKNKNDYE